MRALWHRVPVVLRATLVGLVVASAGTLTWARLITANLRHGANVPWAAALMAPLLCVWWLYFVNGRGWPEWTANARRLGARFNRVRDDLWGPALGAGILGLVTTLLLQGVLSRLITLPRQQDLNPALYPAGTVFAWIVMSALVAGVVEETAFRGYMQGGIERRHGVTTAIVVTGVLFGLSHFSHPEVGVVLLPYYLAVAATYGLLAAATNSTMPSMVLHAGGNVLSAFSLLTQGQSEWQLTAQPQPTVLEAGVDASFIINAVALVVVGALTALAYRALFQLSARSARSAPGA